MTQNHFQDFSFREMHWHMDTALNQAEKAYKRLEVPIGAVLIGPNKEVLSIAHNLKEEHKNPLHHAEMLCIEEASQKLGNWRLMNCTLFVTLEPCPMCMSAINQARIKNVIFGAYDPKGGALSLGHSLHHNKHLNHRVNVLGGFKHFECSQILSQFFRERRSSY